MNGPGRRELLPSQRSIWYLRSTGDEPGDAFLVPYLFEVVGRLDVEAVRHAWDLVRAWQPALSTRIEADLSGPFATEVDRRGLDFEVLDGIDIADARSRVLRPLEAAIGQTSRMAVWQAADDKFLLGATFDHIIFDGWSEHIFWSDFAAIYQAATEESVVLETRRPAIPPVPSRSAADQTYWSEVMAGAVPFRVPGDRLVTSTAPLRSDSYVTDEVAPELAAAVRGIARTTAVTPFAVLLSAFAALLSRYVDSGDIVIAVPSTLRDSGELQKAVNNYLNTLAVRVAVDDSEPFGELVGRVWDAVLGAMAHGAYPFADLVNLVANDRDGAANPVTSVMFNLQQSYGDTAFVLPGCQVRQLEIFNPGSSFDLNLQVSDRADGGIDLYLEYAGDTWSDGAAAAMVRNYARLLEEFGRSADLTVGQPTLHAPSVAVSDRWNMTPPSELPDLGEVVSLSAARTPDAVALQHGDKILTYAQLESQVEAYRTAILSQVAPQDRVALYIDNGIDLVEVIVACLKAGVTYVPLNVADAPARVAQMTVNVAPALVVVADELAARFAEGFGGQDSQLAVIAVSGLAHLEVDQPAPPIAVPPEGAAYIVFTSGTTGPSKGVMCTYQGLSNYIAWATQQYGGDRPGATALVSSLAFDLAVPNLFVGLLQGRTVRILRQPLDVITFADDLLAGAPYAFLKMAPGHLDLLAAQFLPEQMASLTSMVISAGDKFTDRLANTWFDVDGVDVASEYGPTEITIGNSAEFLVAPVTAGLVPLGCPIPGTSMYVLDHAQRQVPAGGVGEVYIGGIGVASGYFGRPALTAERFLPDPWVTGHGTRMYRTGDLARSTASGQVLFEGRRDGQVKIRGFRVETDEVANVLAAHPSVRNVFVDVQERHEGVTQLLAWLVSAPDTDVAELDAYARTRLPTYMVPTAYLVLDQLPTTPNGKVDRAELHRRAERLARPQADAAPVGQSPAEAAVAEVWRSVLGPGLVDLSKSFFDVGGDSIRAVTIVGQLKARGYQVNVQDVFRYRTVRSLVEVLQARPHGAGPGGSVAPYSQISADDRGRLPGDVTDAYPLSAVQLGMLIELMESDGVNYHNVTSYRIDNDVPVDRARFEQAVASVVAEEDILRTSIAMEGFSTPLQLVHREAVMEVSYRDCRGTSPEAGRAALREVLDAERARDFSFDSCPLFRIALQQFDDHWRLTFGEFHPILEGWSLHVMLMRILNRYRGHEISSGPTRTIFPATRPRFADFIQLDAVESRASDVLAYWTELLTGTDQLILPQPDPEPDAASAVTYVNYADLTPALRALASGCDVPLKSVVHAAHLLVMLKIASPPGDRRPYSGLVCDTRPEVEGFDSVIGNYLNTVPFVIPEYGERDQFIKDVFAQEIALWPHRRVSMGYLARMRAERVAMPVAFAYLNFHVVDSELFNMDEGVDDSPNEFGLMVTSQGDSDLNLIGRLDEATRRLLETEYRAVLEALVGSPDGVQKWLGDTHTRVAEPVTSTLHTSADVWAHLRRAWEFRPDEPALLLDDGHLTAGAMLARTETLAGRLAQLCSSSERPVVAVALTRTAALVISQLAVLLSGACLMMIDPDAPPARTIAQLDHVRPEVVLVDAGAEAKLWLEGRAVVVLSPHGGVVGDEASSGTDGDRFLGNSTFDERTRRAAFIMFTSGSTGVPKAAVNSLSGFLNELDQMMRHYPLTRGDRALYKAPVTFDVSVNELFWPLLSGAALVVAKPGGHLDASYLLDLVRSRAVTCAHFVPSVLDTLLRIDDRGDSFASLRVVISSGEALPASLVERFAERAVMAELVNMYGPAETAIHVTHSRTVPGRDISIGQAFDNVLVDVVDDDGFPVKIGAVGQIAIGERAAGFGYLDQPALTASSFRPAPRGAPGSRLYFTGDLGRMQSDRTITYLGRADRQVKINGVRIELEEVEQALEKVPGVLRAVVSTGSRTTPETNARLVAFVVARPGAQVPPADELRHWLLATLASTHVPAQFLAVEQLPLTPNGKVDVTALHRRLPAAASPGRDEPHPANGDHADVDPRISFIQSTWQRVLGTATVGMHDNFFDLGGQSLDAMYVAARLTTRFGVKVRVADILEAPTVAAQFKRVVGGATTAGAVLRLQAGQADRTVVFAPPIGGNSIAYKPLAERLAVSGFGVLVARPFPASSPRLSLAEAADAHVASWLASGLTSPWRLAGWSFGGALAYEMCVSLVERGEEVDVLHLLDPAFPSADVTTGREPGEQESAFLQFNRIDSAQASRLRAEGRGTYEAELAAFAANLRMLDTWTPRLFPRSRVSRVVMVQSKDDVAERYAFWHNLMGSDFTLRHLDVDHYGVIEDPASITEISQLISDCSPRAGEPT